MERPMNIIRKETVRIFSDRLVEYVERMNRAKYDITVILKNLEEVAKVPQDHMKLLKKNSSSVNELLKFMKEAA